MPLLPILTLTFAAFAIGTTEFAVQGLLPDIALSLGVGIPQTGLLVTGYALGVALGSPVLAVATARLPRKTVLLLLLGLFVLGHFIAGLAPNYAMLLVARIVAALCHGTFMGVGSVVAVAIVPPERRASAVALMWGGIASANILGVPAGTALGHAFGWRSTFFAIMALGILAAIAIALWLPDTGRQTDTRLSTEVRVLGRPQVLLVMAMSACVCAATFSVFTFIAPLLETVTGITSEALPFHLLLFGLGGVIGMQVGGRLGDRNIMAAIIGAFIADFLVYLMLSPAIHQPAAALVALFAWGFAFYFMAAPLQLRVVDAAREAPNLASTVIQSAFNFGIAAGPLFGALILGAGLGYTALPIAGAALSAIGVALGIVAVTTERRATGTSIPLEHAQ